MNTAIQTIPAPARTMRLYDLAASWELIADEIVDAGGEITPEIASKLDALESILHAKADAICSLVQRFNRQATAAHAEADRLVKLANVRDRAAGKLAAYLKTCMEMMNTPKIETDIFRVRVQKNGRPAIRCDVDPASLPAEFRKEITTVSMQADALLEAWKMKRELPPGVMVTQGTHLRIY